jgi:hypothetical protein
MRNRSIEQKLDRVLILLFSDVVNVVDVNVGHFFHQRERDEMREWLAV